MLSQSTHFASLQSHLINKCRVRVNLKALSEILSLLWQRLADKTKLVHAWAFSPAMDVTFVGSPPLALLTLTHWYNGVVSLLCSKLCQHSIRRLSTTVISWNWWYIDSNLTPRLSLHCKQQKAQWSLGDEAAWIAKVPTFSLLVCAGEGVCTDAGRFQGLWHAQLGRTGQRLCS